MALRLFLLQRVSAALMVPLIAMHIWLIYYATADGLSAADILSRTRGSLFWGLFYTVFVVLVSVHAAIGLRSVLADWSRFDEPGLDTMTWLAGLLLLVTGLRAVAAVVLPGGLP